MTEDIKHKGTDIDTETEDDDSPSPDLSYPYYHPLTGELIRPGAPNTPEVRAMREERDNARRELLKALEPGPYRDLIAFSHHFDTKKYDDFYNSKRPPLSPEQQRANAASTARREAALKEVEAMQEAMYRWQDKAIECLRQGKSAACDFDDDILSPEQCAPMRADLANCHTAAEVRELFESYIEDY